MVPWLTGVGVDGVLPLERQAGVDGMKLRQQFPHLRMIGTPTVSATTTK